MSKVKHYCRSCGAYGGTPCFIVGHISEQMLGTPKGYRPYTKPKLVVTVPPTGGRGSVEWVSCDADGKAVS